MNKKTVGIISVVASCMVYGITKHFFVKDREKKREEENKIVHDSIKKIFSESRDKRMEKLDLELEKKKSKEELYDELLKRSFDMTLTAEENMKASCELGKLNGVEDGLETIEDLDKYFKG